MQSVMHPAFAQKLAVLAALLERSQCVRAEAHSRFAKTVPQHQALCKGAAWEVVETFTGRVHQRGLTYADAMQMVETLESRERPQ